MNNIAVFIDLNRTNFDFEVFKDIFLNLQKYGKIIYGKLYNFSSSKHKDYLNIISKYEFETAPKKKTALSKGAEDVLDIRQVVDILDLAHSKTKIDTMFLITGNGNVVPVIKSLKMKNIFVIGAYDYTEKNNRDMCDENFDYNLSNKIEIKKEEVTQTEKPVKTPKASAKEPAKKIATQKEATKTTKKAPVKKEISKPAEKTKTEKENKTASKPAKKIAVKKTEPKSAIKKQEKPIEVKKASAKKAEPKTATQPAKKSAEKKEAVKPVEKTTSRKKAPVKKEQKTAQEKKPVAKKQAPVKKPVEKTVPKQEKNSGVNDEEQYYISVLENFASRTSLLNFEYNEDIEQKLELLRDIEQFVEEEKAIQYEKDEFNPEIMAVLRELGNLATDIRATIDDSKQDGDIFDY